MNFSSTDKITENLFTVPDKSWDRLQDVLYPSEEEILSILTNSQQNIPQDIADTAQFKTNQPLVVVRE